MICLPLLTFLCVVSPAISFAPHPRSPRGRPANLLQKNRYVQTSTRGRHVLRPTSMSSDGAEEAKKLAEKAAKLREEIAAMEVENAKSKPPPNVAATAAGAPAAPEKEKPEISDTMKEKLRRELVSQGADPNKKAGNPILIVAGIIAVLVILGGQGIFYSGVVGVESILRELVAAAGGSVSA